MSVAIGKLGPLLAQIQSAGVDASTSNAKAFVDGVQVLGDLYRETRLSLPYAAALYSVSADVSEKVLHSRSAQFQAELSLAHAYEDMNLPRSARDHLDRAEAIREPRDVHGGIQLTVRRAQLVASTGELSAAARIYRVELPREGDAGRGDDEMQAAIRAIAYSGILRSMGKIDAAVRAQDGAKAGASQHKLVEMQYWVNKGLISSLAEDMNHAEYCSRRALDLQFAFGLPAGNLSKLLAGIKRSDEGEDLHHGRNKL